MHPNDILFVLAFALLNPLASAAPIFPNSNDIDENGYFIPEVNQRDLKDDLNHAIDDANSALTSIAGKVDQSYNPPDIPHLPKRDLIGNLEGFVNNGVHTVEQGVNGILGGILKARDLKGDLNSAIDDANSALQSIAGNVDQSFDPPDIPHLPRRDLDQRDLVGTLEGVVNTGINTVEHGVNGILGGIFGKRDGDDGLHLTLAEIESMQAASTQQTKRDLDQRDLVGTLEGVVNTGINTVEHGVNGILGGIFGKRDGDDGLHLTLAEIERMQAANTQQTKRDLDQRDLVGILEGFVNSGVNTVEQGVNGILGGIFGKRDGDDGLHLTLAEIERMQAAANQQTKRSLEQRDLVGDVNGIIDTANRDFGRIAGDVDPNIDLPDIPHIPSKRGEFPGPVTGGEWPHMPGVDFGHGPVVSGTILPK
ncbi:hypothetical protein G7Y79_00006g019460 [Physcia stellaris]|nr:hypothetical protein G7Y79_00006g019460 [Physcia stellaris]